MILLLPMSGFCTYYKSTNDSIPEKKVIMKALIKCDSINTLLSKNLTLAQQKDSIMSQTLMYQRKVLWSADSTLVAERKAFKKEKRNSNIKTAVVSAPVAIVVFQLIKTLFL